jgi:hypothetical protein
MMLFGDISYQVKDHPVLKGEQNFLEDLNLLALYFYSLR